MQLRLDKFFESAYEPFKLDNVTIKDAIKMLRDGSFDRYFDRERIINYLRHIAQNIDRYYGREFCPRCGCTNVKVVTSYKGAKRYFECRSCGKKFVHRFLIKTHFPDWVIVKLVEGVYSGKPISEIAEDIRDHAGNDDKVPDVKTLYDLNGKIAEALVDLETFLVLLIGGLNCTRIMCDDAFSPRYKHCRKYKQRSLNGTVIFFKNKRKGRYYYVIVALDPDLRYILAGYVSYKRDSKAFGVAFAVALEKIRGLPFSVLGDKLKVMTQAAERYLPKNKVRHEFRKLKWYEKKELNKIENRIRKLRKTIGKRRKYGSIRVLRNYLAIAIIGTNYLEHMKVLNNKTPAQAAGIPYPELLKKKWYYFLEYARLIYTMLPQILKNNLKIISGMPLKTILV
ncbi:MAG: DDE-type integrase/transposase/recombinase [Nitrososphaeria archaeon]